ncbi:MAG: ATP-binding cassette domain-containing protein, partial [Thermoleophilia bacterium]|nr:ATP-binding cassette domain-containing protein [Thermoleophilia bacterium]
MGEPARHLARRPPGAGGLRAGERPPRAALLCVRAGRGDAVADALIRATGLVRRFGERRAVDRVDLELAPGETLAVLGPNGAGKSTLLRMLATLLRPDAGTLEVCGHRCPDRAARARRELGYLGHDPLVYLDLTARQ